MKKIVTLIFFVAFVFSNAQKPKIYSTNEQQTIKTETYRLFHTQDWIKEEAIAEFDFILMHSESKKNEEKIPAVISLKTEDVEKDMTVSIFRKVYTENLKNRYPEFKKEMGTAVVFNGNQGEQLIWSNGKSTTKETFYIKNNRVYILVFSCDKTNYENYEAQAEKVLRTFDFI